MTSLRSALSLGLAVSAFAAATLWRASAREARAEAAQPPTGRFVTVAGQRVHYVTRGAGPDLVLIHGASGSLRDFGFGLMEALATRYRVTAFDRPGFGHSAPLASGDARLAAQVAVLRAAAEAIGLERPMLLGQSYGGAVALAWALQGAALQAPPPALVLVSAATMPWPGTLDPWYRLNETAAARAVLTPLASAYVPRRHLERVIAGIFAPDPVPEGYAEVFATPLTTRRATLRVNLAQVNALRAEVLAMEPLYAGLALPVELIHGDADPIVPLHIHSEPLSRRLPDAALTVITGAGHMPHHAHLAEVTAAVDRAAARAGLHPAPQSP